MRKILSLLSILLVTCVSRGIPAATWYVDASVSASGDGTTWAMAFKTIQEGIDPAANGDTVIVARGTYVENVHFRGKNIALRSTDPFRSDVIANTIIDGSQTGSVVMFEGTEEQTCVLSGFTVRNGAADNGAGICGGTSSDHAHAAIENNVLIGNFAGQRGGGLVWCDGIVQNNLIAGNSAGEQGGGGLSQCNATIRNNTIVGNSSSAKGGGLSECLGTIINCVIWENRAPSGAQLYDSSEPSHSCVQGWFGGGVGNISMNPQFVNPDGPDNDPNTYHDNDYRLSPPSPCIDTGKNEDWMSQAVDPDGYPRIVGERVDMGAYEWCSKVTGIEFLTMGDLKLTWSSRLEAAYTIWSCSDPSGKSTWTEETTILSGGELTIWADPNPASVCKFYKIQSW